MKSKAKFATNKKLVVWLPTVFFAAAMVWWIIGIKLGWAWVSLIGVLALLIAMIISALFTIRHHERLRQPGWLHLLNMAWLAVAILILISDLAIIGSILTWPDV